jgi:D-hydroxyproline dehydrogenase subunit gamma
MCHRPSSKSSGEGLLRRLFDSKPPPIRFTVDGETVEGSVGDTVLTAVLMNVSHLRNLEFNGEPRAGFCLIGACQDCWIAQENGPSIRACTTKLSEGMALVVERSAS